MGEPGNIASVPREQPFRCNQADARFGKSAAERKIPAQLRRRGGPRVGPRDSCHSWAVLNSIDCVVLAVRDLEAAVDSYARLFGRSPAVRQPGRDEGLETVRFPLGNTTLALSAVIGRGPFADAISARIDRHGEGILSVLFRTDDADACALELRDRGLEALAPLDREGPEGSIMDRRTVVLPPSATRGTILAAVEHGDGVEGPEGLPPGGPDAASTIHGLDHVVVNSPDIESSRVLYGEGLGLRLALDRSFEARGLRMLFFRIGGVTVEVVGSLDTIPDGKQPDRFGGLAWKVEDVHAARARMTRQGFDVSEQRPGNKAGTCVFSVRSDTCGVPTLIIGPE